MSVFIISNVSLLSTQNARSIYTDCHDSSDLFWTLGAAERTRVSVLKMAL
jgi:hypothetical protein